MKKNIKKSSFVHRDSLKNDVYVCSTNFFLWNMRLHGCYRLIFTFGFFNLKTLFFNSEKINYAFNFLIKVASEGNIINALNTWKIKVENI